MKSSVNHFFLILLLFAVTFGCATPPKIEEVKPVWPSAPDEPRIAYIKSWYGEEDFAKKESSFLDTLLGEEGGGGMRMARPQAVAVDKDGTLYVVDSQLAAVFVFDEKNSAFGIFGGSGRGRVSIPSGIAFDNLGNTIFISDAKQKKVFGFDKNGGLKVAIGKEGEFERPSGLAVSEALKRLYVVDTHGHKVKAYTTKGDFLFEFGERGHEEGGQFNFPTFAAIDSQENVYIVDSQNFRVQVFDKDGKFIRLWGEVGDIPGRFARPKGVGIDSDDNVYIIDAAFENIQVFNKETKILLFFGTSGMDPGYFNVPAGMYIDKNTDRIYVADGFNQRVQVLQYLSEKFKKEKPLEYKEILDRGLEKPKEEKK
ncbi:MAG: hypothetical protein HZB79_12540 [Deltaproteobacteria bacterium]|nr:hypothetical protein [Deltaproteobacteria bacterium]